MILYKIDERTNKLVSIQTMGKFKPIGFYETIEEAEKMYLLS